MSKKLPSVWVAASEAAQQLGVTAKYLREKLKFELKEGYHYRDIASVNAARPSYKWHLKRIEEYLNKPREKR